MQTEHLEARASASLFLHPRVGVVVPKHKHTVVDRNRIRRQLREIVRIRMLPRIGSVDVLLRAKQTAYNSSFDQLAAEVEAVTSWARELVVQG
jgi:ribonuclease P protein component